MQVDQQKAIELMNNLRKEIKKVILDNATAASTVAINSTDPHIPIVGCVQMAFIQSSVEYMVLNGATVQDAIPLVLNAVQNSIQAWLNKCVTPVPTQPLKKAKRIISPKQKLIIPGT